MHNPRTIYLLILVSALVWCGAILCAPLLVVAAPSVSRGIYAFFHLICHQYEVRSLHVVGHPLAVCSRCSAIYYAFLAGVLLYPLVRNRMTGLTRLILLSAAIPMVLDVAGAVLGVYEPSNGLRVATGAAFGLVAALIVLPDAIEGTRMLMLRVSHKTHQQGDNDASKAQ